MANLFTPPQRTQVIQVKGSLRVSYQVSQTVWRDSGGVYHTQESASTDDLMAAQWFTTTPCVVDDATAAGLTAAGIGTLQSV